MFLVVLLAGAAQVIDHPRPQPGDFSRATTPKSSECCRFLDNPDDLLKCSLSNAEDLLNNGSGKANRNHSIALVTVSVHGALLYIVVVNSNFLALAQLFDE